MTSDRSRGRLIENLIAEGIKDESVLGALEEVPRHFFVEESIAHLAYENRALPIGKRQTISQPFVVALMTEAIMKKPNVSKVLEIGTGCGYQTAILAQLVEHVFSVERIESLSLAARSRIRRLGLENVRIRFGDGLEGWEEHAPYDAVIVTAATSSVPEALKSQVGEDGRIVVPLGRAGFQKLVCLDQTVDGWKETYLESVTFVPLLAGTTQ
ncbi:MAG: protein-L-isoaspartate(D-aspartate) O-methyltransferase [Gammaproteobacteria bacterium]|nr:protein-L-isoaspartate(D-aspartate) O-methyltransferase [Gammaproteobacteria bacterium]